MSTAIRPGAAPGPSWAALSRRLRDLSLDRTWFVPLLFAVANAVAVLVIAPGVNDIWAALARESAVGHGVGLTYWFSWFAGGAAPASYSVLVPYLSHLVGVRLLAALATVAWTPLAWLALRDTDRVRVAVWLATVLAAANLWSGRLPFLFGTAFAIAACVTLQRRWTTATVVLAVLSSFGSPESGAFLALALVGVFVADPSRRRACALSVGVLAVLAIVFAVLFGTPGPEHFSFVELLSCIVPFALYLATRPPAALKWTLWLAIVAGVLMFVIPNPIGAAYQRFTWYCLPPVVIAYAGRRLLVPVLTILPALVFGTIQLTSDVVGSAQPNVSPHYYAGLVGELTKIGPPLRDQRLEVVDDGTHAASYMLLDSAMLARGWETRTDAQLDRTVLSEHLNAAGYLAWLRNNAAGYVAISHRASATSYEYTLVSKHPPGYLHELWQDASWTLYRVAGSDHIVDAPVRVTHFSQAELDLSVPCACRFTVRVHYSRYLTAGSATLRPDDHGWTIMRTAAPGTYRLTGSLSHLFG